MTDEALVELARAHPQQGFAAIYDLYGERLYAYCHRLLRSSSDAADAVQECFLTALTKLDQLRDPAKLRAWLYAIARNHCMRHFRNRTRETPQDATELEVAAHEDPETSQLVQIVVAATNGLSDIDRHILDLNVRHELDGEELASSLGVPASKSYVMLHRAKERLQGAVKALLVARAGVNHCTELAELVGSDFDERSFTPLVRKRVNRHVASCDLCAETTRRHRPEAYLALLPLVRPPAGLDAQIARAVANAERAARASSLDASETANWRWAPDGFPPPIEVRRKPPVGVVVGAGALVLLAIVLLGGNRLDSGAVEVVAVAGPPTTVIAAPQPTLDPDESRTGTSAAPAPEDPTPAPTIVATAEPTTTATPEVGPTATTVASEPLPVAPTATPTPRPPTPTATPEPTATATPVPTATPTVTPTPTITPNPDVVPPTVGPLVIDCSGDPYTAGVLVTDNVDQSPSVDLVLTFNFESDPPQPLTRVLTVEPFYFASVSAAEDFGGVIFYVRGNVSDDAGNVTNVDVTDSCGLIE